MSIIYTNNMINNKEYKCTAYNEDKLLATLLYDVIDNDIYAKGFFYSDSKLDSFIAKKMVQSVLSYAKDINISSFITYPIQNKNILLMLAEFDNVKFVNKNKEINVDIIKTFKCKNNSFHCVTDIEDLLSQEDRITAIIPIEKLMII